MKKEFTRLKYKIIWDLNKKHNPNIYYKKLGYSFLNPIALRSRVKTALLCHSPLCIGKIGGTECFAMSAQMLFGKTGKIKAYNQLCNLSGFFPNNFDEDYLARYSTIQADAISSTDILISFCKCYEEYILKKYCHNNLEMITFDTFGDISNSWTKELAEKKVLVIHPFATLIEQQYQNREFLYKDKEYLPEFELKTIQAVQSLGGICNEGYLDWFEALDAMKHKMNCIDYDVALIGCGAYGLPLASEAKKNGKVAIHMGADLQLLFGIKGKRWDTEYVGNHLYNDYWVYPGEEYRPISYKNVEDGCYW